MSDHKLLKVTRFSKSFRQNPRYVKKRMFKNFDNTLFRQQLSESNLEEILHTTDVNTATELLVTKLTNVLDKIAPVRTVQTRTRYAAWIGEGTKELQRARDEAQEKHQILIIQKIGGILGQSGIKQLKVLGLIKRNGKERNLTIKTVHLQISGRL